MLAVWLAAGCGESEADPFGEPGGSGGGGQASAGGSGGAITGGTGGAGGAPGSCAPREADAVYAWTYTWMGGDPQDVCFTSQPSTRPGLAGGVPTVYGCPSPADLTSCNMDVEVTCSPAVNQTFTFTGEIAWAPDGRTCAGTIHLVAKLPQGQGCNSFFNVTCVRQ